MFKITKKILNWTNIILFDLRTSKFICVAIGTTVFLLLSFTYPNLKKRITDNEFRYEFYTTSKEVLAKSDRLYFWFKGGAIHISEYGVSGELLHGEFEKFFLNNQLAEKGSFKNGLKKGLWKTWHKNGKLATIINYNSGKKNGTFYEYNPEEKLIEKGKYKNGKKHGKWYNFITKERVDYNRGEAVIVETKKEKSPNVKEKKLQKSEAQKIKSEEEKIKKEKLKNESKKNNSKNTKEKVVKQDDKNNEDGFFKRLFSKKEKKPTKSNAEGE